MKKILLILLLSILLLSACSDKESSTPENNVLTKELIAFSDTLFATVHSQLPGMLIYISAPDKNVELTYCKGFANLSNNTEISTKNSFRIASNTKTFVITILLQLVQENKLSLDDHLNRWYPSFPQADQITIRQLSNMTSGVYDYRNSQELAYLLQNQPQSPPRIDSLIAISASHGLNSLPGTTYEYSNTNTLILGKIIERETGNSLNHELQTRIFTPLGLSSTYFAVDNSIPANMMHGYGDFSNNLIDATTLYHPDYAWAAGSIVSNLRDMKIWLKALANGALLTPEMQNQRLQFITASETTSYGLGIMRAYGFLGHIGGMPGYLSVAFYNPEKDCTIIMVYNSSLISPSIYLGIHCYSLIDILYPELGINKKKCFVVKS